MEAVQSNPVRTVRPSAAALLAEPPASSAEELASCFSRFQEFAYVVSHDLHAPLRLIISFAQLLQERSTGAVSAEEESDYLMRIICAGRYMQEKLDGLLIYSRLNTMTQMPSEDIDSKVIVENCLDLLRARIQEKQGQIHVGALPQICADTDQIHQLFMYLLDNALKFSSADKTPVIQLDAAISGSDWQFSIADNGIGIEPEYREEAFRLFRQLNAADAYPGIGLGLTLARKVVEHHGGKIWLENNPPGGTKVCFTLPRER
jgi:signal transduction histidine kinase